MCSYLCKVWCQDLVFSWHMWWWISLNNSSIIRVIHCPGLKLQSSIRFFMSSNLCLYFLFFSLDKRFVSYPFDMFRLLSSSFGETIWLCRKLKHMFLMNIVTLGRKSCEELRKTKAKGVWRTLCLKKNKTCYDYSEILPSFHFWVYITILNSEMTY